MKLSCDFSKYVKLLKPVASLSHLFSDNSVPYVSPKFVERLYILSAGAKDTAADNSSFDAIAPNKVGVGVKTFIASQTARHKFEKIAEFTADANAGVFDGLSAEKLLLKAIELRNLRLSSDAIAYGIKVSDAIYHCLIRMKGSAMIHEEPMSVVNENELYPVDSSGNRTNNFGEKPIISDGRNVYTYNKSKRVLYKRFAFQIPPTSDFGGIITLPINRNILDELLVNVSSDNLFYANQSNQPESSQPVAHSAIEVNDKEDITEANEYLETGISNASKCFVILPLYSTRTHEVPASSGINQWNAAGRARSFGESYIPVPAWIHREFPNFFPGRDQTFKLKLQDGTLVNAKLCQDGAKALMSDPNDELCRWLYTALEPELEYSQIKRRLPEERPYTYADLKRVGKDCVKVSKVEGQLHQFELSFCGIGQYEEFELSAS